MTPRKARPDKVVVDKKPLAAYRLGYLCRARVLEMWLRFCWKGTRTGAIEDPWGGFRPSIKQLQKARLGWPADSSNVFAELPTVLKTLDRLFKDLHKAWKKGDTSIEWGVGEPFGENLLLNFTRPGGWGSGRRAKAADPGPLRRPALGDFRLELVDRHRLAHPLPGLESTPTSAPSCLSR